MILHCAGGGRAALAGKTLKDMGYTKVFNGGGFKDLGAGIEVESRHSARCGAVRSSHGLRPSAT